MASLRQLERDLDRLGGRLLVAVVETIRDVTIEVGKELVTATPVLTGFARANWRPALSVPAIVPVTALDPTGSATIAKITAVAKHAGIGDTLFIVNNAPYIAALNRGSSPQAPRGFVKASVKTGTETALRKIRIRRIIQQL